MALQHLTKSEFVSKIHDVDANLRVGTASTAFLSSLTSMLLGVLLVRLYLHF